MSPTPEHVVALQDPLAGDGAVEASRSLEAAIDSQGPVVVDLSNVHEVDTFGMAALGNVVRRLRAAGRTVEIRNAPERATRLATFLRLDEVLEQDPESRIPVKEGFLQRTGILAMDLRERAVLFLAMLWDGYRYGFTDPMRKDPVKREGFFRQMTEIGFGAVPIVVLINLMIGVILAIQMAYVLRDYGATIFIAKVVGISMSREIGPLLCAILVAGRSGSAIAAEIGTMVVTEEVDALEMMALRPRRFLLSPRFAALALSVPALSVFGVVAGMLGGAAVGVLQYEIGGFTYYNETVTALKLTDIGSGLLKSFFFGNLVAIIGCMHGLRLRGGPEAVGQAATTAVVQSIIAVILFDAFFTWLSFQVF
ncbi:MAG: MlaE family lipid ABC transporter permease subunit [Planctomycetota bacterium]|jgi:phospholipid/cholesterol/gamma-HCH transport system permease protein